jgi:hypothetical protein
MMFDDGLQFFIVVDTISRQWGIRCPLLTLSSRGNILGLPSKKERKKVDVFKANSAVTGHLYHVPKVHRTKRPKKHEGG